MLKLTYLNIGLLAISTIHIAMAYAGSINGGITIVPVAPSIATFTSIVLTGGSSVEATFTTTTFVTSTTATSESYSSLPVATLGSGSSSFGIPQTCLLAEIEAISMLCEGPLGGDLTVPSSFAADGVTYDGIHASILADCSQVEQITSDECYFRFFEACGNLQKAASFGTDACQRYQLNDVIYDR